MKPKIISACFVLIVMWGLSPLSRAEEPIIPPTLSKIWPAGMERGATATFTLDGRNLTGAGNVIFDAPGITGKVVQITDVPEMITAPRVGVDTSAQVPLGKKQTAKLEITAARDVEPGVHKFRLQTPYGTTNMAAVAIGALPEINKSADASAQPQLVKLPATLIGAIESPGAADSYIFEGKSGEEMVFQVMASELDSQLQSELAVRDAAGQVIAQAGENDNRPDAVLTCKLPHAGQYTLSISDREKGGDKSHFYRLNAGALPYITGVFPLGVRAGQANQVAVSGINLGDAHEVKITPPHAADGWTTTPLEIRSGNEVSLNKVILAVGNEPEILEQEPNNTAAQSQAVSLPVTINGRIDGLAKSGGAADEDFFRFHALQGEAITIDVAASRLGSRLDSLIEVLDAQGNPVQRATVRCLNQTNTTLSDRDSRTQGIRLVSTSGFHEGDFVMLGDELDQIAVIPDQPDSDVFMKGINGLRQAFLGTSPDAHATNTTVYRAQAMPPNAEFPPNGLPVFHLTWRNDDGGPGYGADSKLDFVAPSDGDYIVHLKDVRSLEGPDFSYQLTLHDANLDYQLRSSPENPNIPRGGAVPVTVSADRLAGYEGPIVVEVKGLPPGVTASAATIPQGQDSTLVVLSATPGAQADSQPPPIRILGHAKVDGRDTVREANRGVPLQLASIMPAPDVVVTTEAREVSLEPGKELTVTLHVNRENGFKGRVPCFVQNLPPGVRVVNVGLNGVLVTETQTSRTFTIRAEEWAKPITQPIYVVAEIESNSSTMHASPAILLKVAQKEMASTANGAESLDRKPESGGSPHHR